MENYLEINYEKNMNMLSEAVNYCEENFLHDDLINALYTDNDLKKQLCLIELKAVYNQEEADIIVFNLTNHSGPVREAASYAILDLIKNNDFNKFFQTENIINSFIKAVTDINPSVSRNSVEIIKYVNNAQYIYNNIIEEINITLKNIDNITKNHSYTANKKNFNLYWNLEALISIADKITANSELVEILNKTALSNDYTIREKTAKTAVKYIEKNNDLVFVVNLLKNDENIYVKKLLACL